MLIATHRHFCSPIVTVRVGVDEHAETFYVHKDALRSTSSFFKAALNEDFKEAKTNSIELPEDDPSIFKLYLCWIYDISPFTEPKECIPDSEGEDCGEETDNEDTNYEDDDDEDNDEMDIEDNDETNDSDYPFDEQKPRDYCYRLLAAWRFGNKVLDNDFCDMVIDQLCLDDATQQSYSIAAYSRIYELAPKNSAPRKLLIDAFTFEGGPEWFDNSSYIKSAEMWKAIAKSVMVQWSDQTLHGRAYQSRPVDKCRYHLHNAETGLCYKDTKHFSGAATS